MSNLLFERAYIVVNKKRQLDRLSRKIYSSKGNAENDMMHGKDFAFERKNGTEMSAMSIQDYIWLVGDMARCCGDRHPWDE